MADFLFGQAATGRFVAYADRVINNDPADSDWIAVPMATAGTAEQGETLTTLAAVEADANFSERTGNGWSRITITGLAVAWDATNNRNEVDFDNVVWGTPGNGPTAGTTVALLICYIPDNNPTGGISADSAVVPIGCLDFAVTPNGQQVTYNVNAEGAFHAARV